MEYVPEQALAPFTRQFFFWHFTCGTPRVKFQKPFRSVTPQGGFESGWAAGPLLPGGGDLVGGFWPGDTK